MHGQPAGRRCRTTHALIPKLARAMKKKFMIAEASEEPVTGQDVVGYLLLARDGEAWRVGRRTPEFLPPEWRTGLIIEVSMRYAGPDVVTPNWQAMGCDRWQPMRARNPFDVVARHWGQECAERFVP